MKVAFSMNVCIGESKAFTVINEIVIFHLHELLANVHRLPATNESEICQLKQQLVNSFLIRSSAYCLPDYCKMFLVADCPPDL